MAFVWHQFQFVGPSGDTQDGDAALAAYNASPERGNRWLIPDAEQRYSLRILNRRTGEYRDIPFSRMTRNLGGGQPNYNIALPDLEDFMTSLPHYADASLAATPSFQSHGARVSIIEKATQTLSVSEPLTLYSGKLHSLVKRREANGGYTLYLAFSGPFAKFDSSSSVIMTPADQKSRDSGDTSLDSLDSAQAVRWAVKG